VQIRLGSRDSSIFGFRDMAKVIIINTCDDCPLFSERSKCKRDGSPKRGDDGCYEVPADCPLDESGREIEMDFYGEDR